MLQHVSFEALDFKIFGGACLQTPLEHMSASCGVQKSLAKIYASPPSVKYWIRHWCPQKTRYGSHTAVYMLGHRLRRWPNT